MPSPSATFRLFLLRHAQAAWAQPGESDLDRALDETGRRQAESVAMTMEAQNWRPERILCSSALRCRQTAAPLERIFGQTVSAILPELYTGDAAAYRVRIIDHASDNRSSVLVVGHNPTIEEVLCSIVGDDAADHATGGGYEPAGLSVIDLARESLERDMLTGTLLRYCRTR